MLHNAQCPSALPMRHACLRGAQCPACHSRCRRPVPQMRQLAALPSDHACTSTSCARITGSSSSAYHASAAASNTSTRGQSKTASGTAPRYRARSQCLMDAADAQCIRARSQSRTAARTSFAPVIDSGFSDCLASAAESSAITGVSRGCRQHKAKKQSTMEVPHACCSRPVQQGTLSAKPLNPAARSPSRASPVPALPPASPQQHRLPQEVNTVRCTVHGCETNAVSMP